jgi:hypothetical protein
MLAVGAPEMVTGVVVVTAEHPPAASVA